jgi:hypothetical protein
MRAGALLLMAALGGCVHNNPLYDAQRRAAIEGLNLGGSRPVLRAHRLPGLQVRFAERTNWSIARETEKYFAASKTLTRLHTTALVVGMLPPPAGAPLKEEDFQREARRSRDVDHSGELNRLDFKTEPGVGKWKTCMQYYRKYTTTTKEIPNTLLLYEENGYLCRHPSLDLYYRIDYSERYPADADAPEFRRRAEQILEYAQFSD